MTKTRTYDLEKRTYIFAQNINKFCKKFHRTIPNIEYIKQLVRSSASIGANYIEANEAISKKDFIFRIKLTRKEAKETTYWLKLLIGTNSQEFKEDGGVLITESIELRKILSSILSKTQSLDH